MNRMLAWIVKAVLLAVIIAFTLLLSWAFRIPNHAAPAHLAYGFSIGRIYRP